MRSWTKRAVRALAFSVVAVALTAATWEPARATTDALIDNFITIESDHDVPATMDKLESIVADKGILVLARVDHGENASNAGLTLRPTQLLIFGNPKIGTQLMQVDQRVGVDLPMKVLVWQDEAGKTWLGYTDPAAIAERYDIEKDHDAVETMRKALAGITAAAAK